MAALQSKARNEARHPEMNAGYFRTLIVAGSLLLVAQNAEARAPEQNVPTRPPVQAPSEGGPSISELFRQGGVTIQIGCPTADMVETFRNDNVTVRENDCGMELTYALPEGVEKKIPFDATERAQRGAIRDVLVGNQFSAIVTENYILVVPGRDSERTVSSSTDIVLPDEDKERSFDRERNLFYFLSPEKRIYVIDVSNPEGDWERSLPNERIGEDAKIAAFRGLLLILQSGELPVLAFQNARPGSEGWVEADYPLNPALEGPISVEEYTNRIVLEGKNATLTVTVGTEGDARSVSVRP